MTRSLILFNALFALQSGLDLTYLWGGASLPDGMSYAHYAHRGAYPLIATALLAAGFVLIAMRPGGPAEQSRLIRPLVLAWIGQNILLVISSIFRLDLYVAAYSLTYLRLAAFIWMGLVATGLLLMLIQIISWKAQFPGWSPPTPSRWRWCCTDAASSTRRGSWRPTMWRTRREAGGTGPWLDLDYLRSLGPQVLARPRTALAATFRRSSPRLRELRAGPDICETRRRRSENWRAVDFRTWRLQRYLANNPGIAPKSLDSGKG